MEVVNLAPIVKEEPSPEALALQEMLADMPPPSTSPRRRPPKTDERFGEWLLDVVRDAVRTPVPRLPPGAVQPL